MTTPGGLLRNGGEIKVKRCADTEPQRIREFDQLYSDHNKKVKHLVRRDWKACLDGISDEAR